MLTVIKRAQKITRPQQLGPLPGIDAFTLVPGFQQGVLPRITRHHFRGMRLE
jgi:hypothetical protein